MCLDHVLECTLFNLSKGNIPVVQVSINPELTMKKQYELRRAIREFDKWLIEKVENNDNDALSNNAVTRGCNFYGLIFSQIPKRRLLNKIITNKVGIP